MPAPRPRPQPIWARVEIDQFAAQVLLAADPALTQIPFVVVRQREDSHRASVFAVSACARARGAEAGMPVFIARRKVGRGFRVLPRDAAAEERTREQLRQHCLHWTPEVQVERHSIRLDLSGTPVSRQVPWDGLGDVLADGLRRCSGLQEFAVGISASRVLAEILARQARPAGIDTCAPGCESARLASVDADSLPGLAGECRERVRMYGLERAEQLLELDRATLIRRFGREQGAQLYGLVRGLAADTQRNRADSVEAETVLQSDVNDDGLLLEAVRLTADKAVHETRRRHLVAGAVRLQLVYSDNRRACRTVRLAASTDDFARLRAACESAFADIHVRRVALKSIHVSALRTSPATGQRDLFDGARQHKDRRLGAALTSIRERLGFGAVVAGGTLSLDANGRPSGSTS